MTGDEKERLFHEKELAFFGAVTASISHELNNAIAIIEQAAGLLEDLIAAAGQEQDIAKERLQKIVDRIERQTRRGATIIKRLNTFAHSVDVPEQELELNELAQNAVALAHRLAERRRVKLESRRTDGPITIRSNPFRIQQALYLCIQKAVFLVPEGSRVVVDTRKQDRTAWLSVEGDFSGTAAPPELDLAYLEMLMNQLDGELDSNVGEGRILIRLSFPEQD